MFSKRQHFIPALGRNVVLVDREQLRRKMHGRTFRVPTHLKGVMKGLPTPPPAFSWSKNGALDYPVLGNDQYGDCYYAAVGHASQTYTGNAGGECTFDVNALVRRYLQIAGGDNGLDDQTIMPEWKEGIVGPNGPRKILDEMTVDPADDAAISAACWFGGGLIYTCSLLDTWLNNSNPGATWDAGGRPDPSAGHAIYLTGSAANGVMELQTWGLKPCIKLTRAGLRAADPELIVAVSLDQFDATGKHVFTGLSYDAVNAAWQGFGGSALPPNPFGPPTPPPPPSPPAPPGAGYVITVPAGLAAGNYTVGASGPPAVDPSQLLQAINDLLAVLGLPPLAFPPAVQERFLKLAPIPWGKVIQIVLLIMSVATAPGGLTPAAIAALMQQILAILGLSASTMLR